MGGPAKIIQEVMKPKVVEQPKVKAQMDRTISLFSEKLIRWKFIFALFLCLIYLFLYNL